MWKVLIDSRYGGEPSVYWVDAATAIDAERVARDQVNRSHLATGESLPSPAPVRVLGPDPEPDPDELWPRPRIIDGIRVHTFASTGGGYDQTQVRDDIHDGDVLYVPSERVAGFLMRAWPAAVTVDTGAFHRLSGDDPVIDGIDYTPSITVARSLHAGAPWTVAIRGPEGFADETGDDLSGRPISRRHGRGRRGGRPGR